MITLNSYTAATRATYTATGNLSAGALASGNFSLNGTTFSFQIGATASEIGNAINAASAQTGVSATVVSNQIVFKSTKFGSAAKINFVDTGGVISTAAGTVNSSAGTDASATFDIGTATNVAFTGGLQGNDGLTLVDADGNKFRFNEAGNVTTATPAAVGQVIVGSAQFQIGANAGQTALLSLGNFAASNLGQGAVPLKNLANIDLTSAAGANDAMKVIDQAINDVSSARGRIGNFQRNILESNVRSLGVAKENLSASESMIRDTDIAAEMSTYTKMQILQQAGLSVLGQANSAPQAVLNLLKG
ncbi:MAG: hypothetical protein C4320_04700 [Armatimonadota bacterium]